MTQLPENTPFVTSLGTGECLLLILNDPFSFCQTDDGVAPLLWVDPLGTPPLTSVSLEMFRRGEECCGTPSSRRQDETDLGSTFRLFKGL